MSMFRYDLNTPYALPEYKRRHKSWYWFMRPILFWRTTGRALPKLFNFTQERKP